MLGSRSCRRWTLSQAIAASLFLFGFGPSLGGQARGAAPSLATPPSPDHGIAKTYTGSASCRACHERFYQLWAPSHHGLALQPFTPQLGQSRLSAMTNELRIGAASYRVDLSKGVVQERSPGGVKTYAMAHAMGGKNVYYFLTPLERGRLQVLPLAYDVPRREWFDMPASAVRHLGTAGDAPLGWRESPFTFNRACFNCHVSQLSNDYDLKTDSYRTSWGEPGINCETCHGPGSEHIRVARAAPPGEPLKDVKLVRAGDLDKDQLNALCGSCHAKMFPLTSSFGPGERFFDHFGLVGLENADFYPDGRDLGENFTFTTWRLSPCLKKGQLDCVHCHTSSGRFRFAGPQSDKACLPCHQKLVENAAEHSHHKAGTHGARCVSCHMPMTEFARMRRSDHSMRAPMPAASVKTGSPNACSLCHTDHDAAWADRWVREWYPRDFQKSTVERAGWIAAARKRDWSALPEILRYLSGSEREEVWAAALIELLRACEDERKWPALLACLSDASPMVRAAAAESCGDRLRPEFVAPLLRAARDSARLVRIRGAVALNALDIESVPEGDRAALRAAVEEHKAFLLARPDDPASHYNLGNFHLEHREYDQAISAFATASRLDPNSVPPLVNASLAYNALGRNETAEENLKRALRLEPTNAAVNLNFGMLMAEMDKLSEAERGFRTAFASDPNSAAAAYNLGVLLGRDRPEEGLEWCRRAARLQPQDAKYAYTLAFFLVQRGKGREAAEALESALAKGACSAECYGLLGGLHERQGAPEEARKIYRRAADDDRLPADAREAFAARSRERTH